MSDPLPPAAPQPEPAPAGPPPPAQWIPAALPVQALEYPLPSRGGRPGILTAIGVLSIIIAAISGLYSLVVGFQGIGFYFMSIAAAQATRAQAASVQAANASVQGGPAPSTQAVGATGAAGMSRAEREAAIQSLTRGETLDSRRRRHL